MKKNILSLVLALCLCLSSFGTISFASSVEPFTDISNHWAEKYINELANRGIVSGVGNGKFNPNGTVRVDEFIKLCVSSLGYTYDTSKFLNWSTPYVNKALELSLITNKEFANFKRAITREEMASILIKAYGKNDSVFSSNLNSEIIKSITDYSLINDYYKDSVLKCYNVGLMQGDKGKFNPTITSTRAQAATVIMRMLEPKERTEFAFIGPYTTATYLDWTDDMGWDEFTVKLFAPKNLKGAYVTEVISFYDFLKLNEKKDVSFYDVSYNPYMSLIGGYFTPYTYDQYNVLGANDRVFHLDMNFGIKLLDFSTPSSFPYELSISKHDYHSDSKKYFEYLELKYPLFLDYYFSTLFGDHSSEAREYVRTILNADNGTVFVEKSYIINNRNVTISAKNGLLVRVSDSLN